MVEIAICLAVIGFALVAIIGVLPVGMNVQKDNREETIVDFDAHYLMDAMRSGAQGQDALTNYIICITNVMTVYNAQTQAQAILTNWFNTFTNNSGQYYSINGRPFQTLILTNGFNIVGLLTTPKYTRSSPPIPRGSPTSWFVSNYITADFRAISGAANDQGPSQTSSDFSFAYRVYPEIIPLGVPDPSLTNFQAVGLSQNDIITRSNNFVLAPNLQNNVSDVRLRFRWPLFANSQNGQGSQVYRTSFSGKMTNFVATTSVPSTYFFQPQNYGVSTSQMLP